MANLEDQNPYDSPRELPVPTLTVSMGTMYPNSVMIGGQLNLMRKVHQAIIAAGATDYSVTKETDQTGILKRARHKFFGNDSKRHGGDYVLSDVELAMSKNPWLDNLLSEKLDAAKAQITPVAQEEPEEIPVAEIVEEDSPPEYQPTQRLTDSGWDEKLSHADKIGRQKLITYFGAEAEHIRTNFPSDGDDKIVRIWRNYAHDLDPDESKRADEKMRSLVYKAIPRTKKQPHPTLSLDFDKAAKTASSLQSFFRS